MSNDNSDTTSDFVSQVKKEINSNNDAPIPSEFWLRQGIRKGTHAWFPVWPLDLDGMIQIDEFITFQTISLAIIENRLNANYPLSKDIPRKKLEIACVKYSTDDIWPKKEKESRDNQAADALTRLRLFFACCNLSSSLNTSAIIVVNSLHWQTITPPVNGYGLPDFQHMQDEQPVGQALFNLLSLDGFGHLPQNLWRGSSNVYNTVDAKESLPENPYTNEIITNSKSLYNTLMNILKNSDKKTKIKLILSLTYYQTAIEQSQNTQTWNFVMLIQCVERLLTKKIDGTNPNYTRIIQACMLVILEKERYFESIEDGKDLLRKLFSIKRAEIIHGKKLPDYYDSEIIDSDVASVRDIAKIILRRVISELEQNKKLDNFIDELEEIARKKKYLEDKIFHINLWVPPVRKEID